MVPKAASPVSVVAQEFAEQALPVNSWKGKGSMPPLQRADSVKQRTIQVGAFTGHIRGNPKQGSCPKHMASQAPFQGAFLPSLHCSPSWTLA